jgi:hypothetical protein
MKLYSITLKNLSDNLKSLTTLLWSESKSATQYKEIITTLYTKPLGVRIRLE